VVGESKELFYVHKDILCEISPFIRAALAGGFREAEDQEIPFPEDDVETFERLVQWVYTRALNLSSYETEAETEAHYLALARLFVLADKLQIPMLKTLTVLTMYESVDKAKWVPPLEVIGHVYANSHRRCGLRRLLVDSYIWRLDYEWYDTDTTVDTLLPVDEFTAELAVGLAQRISHPERLDPFRDGIDEAMAASAYYDQDQIEDFKDQAVEQTVADKSGGGNDI